MTDNFTITLQILFSVADIVFDFWFLVILGPLRWRGSLLRNMLVMWVFLVVLRLFLFFNPDPIASLFIPEPLNTLLFFVAGVFLFTIYAVLKTRNHEIFMGKVSRVNSVKDLWNLSPREFEEMVAELYRTAGHQARRTGAIGDHGVDIVIQAKNGEKWIAQCKRWRRHPVGEPEVRDFYGAMQHEKADKGTIVTTSRFTPQAREWVRGKPITLYDGEKFLQSWKRAKTYHKK